MKLIYTVIALAAVGLAGAAPAGEKRQDLSALVLAIEVVASMQAEASKASLVGWYTATNTPTPAPEKRQDVSADVSAIEVVASMEAASKASLVGWYTATKTPTPVQEKRRDVSALVAALVAVASAENAAIQTVEPLVGPANTNPPAPDEHQGNAVSVLAAALATFSPTPAKRDMGAGMCTMDGQVMPCLMSMADASPSTTSHRGPSTVYLTTTSCTSSTDTTSYTEPMTTVTDNPLFSTGGVFPLWQLTDTQRNNTSAPVTNSYLNISTFSASLAPTTVTTITGLVATETSHGQTTVTSTTAVSGTSSGAATDDAAAAGFSGAVTSSLGNSSSGAMAAVEVPTGAYVWAAVTAMIGVFGAALLL